MQRTNTLTVLTCQPSYKSLTASSNQGTSQGTYQPADGIHGQLRRNANAANSQSHTRTEDYAELGLRAAPNPNHYFLRLQCDY